MEAESGPTVHHGNKEEEGALVPTVKEGRGTNQKVPVEASMEEKTKARKMLQVRKEKEDLGAMTALLPQGACRRMKMKKAMRRRMRMGQHSACRHQGMEHFQKNRKRRSKPRHVRLSLRRIE